MQLSVKKNNSSILTGHGSAGLNFSTWEAETEGLPGAWGRPVFHSGHQVCQDYTERPNLGTSIWRVLSVWNSFKNTGSLPCLKQDSTRRSSLLLNKWMFKSQPVGWWGKTKKSPTHSSRFLNHVKMIFSLKGCFYLNEHRANLVNNIDYI